MRSTTASLFILFLCGAGTRGAEYFVSPKGDDTADGSLQKPFATVGRAQKSAAPGDTVWIRGGTYAIPAEQVARRERIWAYVHFLDKSGAPGKRINYFAYQQERPVFDFSQIRPEGLRVTAFYVPASWVHIRGLEVIGVQVTIKGHTQSICVDNEGSNNVYERLSMHDGQAIGIYSVRGSDNLFLNCDAYRNHDTTSEDGKGGNVDGFGCHPPRGSTGNVFRGCRAWFNSDDGFDCINAHEAVVFENCWAFYNGYSAKFERLADGNGFKAGGYGSTPAARLPNPVPRHTVRSCLAVRNKASGFYANHHIGGQDWFDNTGYRNGADFNMLSRLPDNKTDVPGYGHKLRGNIAYKGGRPIVNLDRAKSDSTGNSFDGDLRVGDADFRSLDESELTQARQADGSLPAIKFLQLSEKSPLLDATGRRGTPR